ncbi:MAG: hypothetical protein KC503_02155 [Myxococcales bacterium]|nr:hypothetical protein [Myxococcales bacterium]
MYRRHLLAFICTTLLALAFSTGCTGVVGEEEWDDDDKAAELNPGASANKPAPDGERQAAFKHGPPSGTAPWTYYLTCYGGPGDSGAYNSNVACGGKKANGNWWYSTGAWSFGCFSKLELRANGKCAVVTVVDNGPAGWVETKAKNKCGGTGYILDVSPLVTKHLHGASCAGWSDCMAVQVRPVASNTPEGPCSGSAPTQPTQPTQPSQPNNNGCHKDVPFGWLYCSASCPCGAGQGDCDNDSECAPGLRCAHNVGAKYGAGSTVDVCEAPPQPTQPSQPTQPTQPTNYGPCYSNGQTGVCQANTVSCSGRYEQNLCPGGNTVQCCLPPSPSVSNVPAAPSQWGTCNFEGRPGVCQSNSIGCPGGYKRFLCPGGNDIQCCLQF